MPGRTPTRRQALIGALVRAAAITGVTFSASRHIPRLFKWIAVFLVVLNIGSYPLTWHFRILYPWIASAVKFRITRKRGGIAATNKRLTQISYLEKHPLDIVEVLPRRATIADCDYNIHLSNSSYGKNLDFVRMNAAVNCFPGFVTAGGTLALGGTFYHFVKEIPLFAEYEIRLHFGGWEQDKWVYLTAAYVSYPKKKSASVKDNKAAEKPATAEEAAKDLLEGVASGHTSAEGLGNSIGSSVVVVPPLSEVSTTTTTTTASTTADSSVQPSGLASPANGVVEGSLSRTLVDSIAVPEGATLHAVAVSLYCFKHGRVTVPPRVAFIASGFGKRERWDRLLEIRKQSGGAQKMKELLRGGWKEEPEFWAFEECEGEGRRKGEQLRELRLLMDGLAGK